MPVNGFHEKRSSFPWRNALVRWDLGRHLTAPLPQADFIEMSNPIVIPKNAPFNAEQRVWLSEFLSKALAGQEVSIEPTGPAIPVTILWGSQTGNSEGIAKKLMKALKAGNYEPEVFEMAGYDKSRLPGEKNLLIITSTYGDGEPPDNAADLHQYLMGNSVPSLKGVNFSILSLGDS